MTKKDLFKIILKLYGLFSIIEAVIQIPNVIFYFYLDSVNDFDRLMLIIPLVSLLVVYILLFKSDSIIQLFKLDQGFDNTEFNLASFNQQGITQLALVIISIYLIVSNIGTFITQILFAFKQSVGQNRMESLFDTFNPNPVDYQLLVSSGINLLVGFILLTNRLRLSNWIEKMNRKNSVESPE